jgi:hypothetical protein
LETTAGAQAGGVCTHDLLRNEHLLEHGHGGAAELDRHVHGVQPELDRLVVVGLADALRYLAAVLLGLLFPGDQVFIDEAACDVLDAAVFVRQRVGGHCASNLGPTAGASIRGEPKR